MQTLAERTAWVWHVVGSVNVAWVALGSRSLLFCTEQKIPPPLVPVCTIGLMKSSLTSKAGCVHEIVWAWPSLAWASVKPAGLRLGVDGFGMTTKSVAGFASGVSSDVWIV